MCASSWKPSRKILIPWMQWVSTGTPDFCLEVEECRRGENFKGKSSLLCLMKAHASLDVDLLKTEWSEKQHMNIATLSTHALLLTILWLQQLCLRAHKGLCDVLWPATTQVRCAPVQINKVGQLFSVHGLTEKMGLFPDLNWGLPLLYKKAY